MNTAMRFEGWWWSRDECPKETAETWTNIIGDAMASRMSKHPLYEPNMSPYDGNGGASRVDYCAASPSKRQSWIVESKASKSDCSKFWRDQHDRYRPWATFLYLAVPFHMEQYAKERLPDGCGLIVVEFRVPFPSDMSYMERQADDLPKFRMRHRTARRPKPFPVTDEAWIQLITRFALRAQPF